MIYTLAEEDKGRVKRKKKGLLGGGRMGSMCCHIFGWQWDACTFYSSI